MQIESSTMAMQSKNSAYSRYEKTEQLKVGFAAANASEQQQVALSASSTVIHETYSLSSFQQMQQQSSASSLKNTAEAMAKKQNEANNQRAVSSVDGADGGAGFNLSAKDKLKLLILMQLLQRFQKDPKLMKELGLDQLGLGYNTGASEAQNSQGDAGVTNPPAANIDYSTQERLYQSETAQFSAAGQVKTADGQTISISIALNMSRETLQTADTSIRLASATKDPLVINFDGTAAELSEQRFSFDLSANGQKDLIPQLLGNRAFLALDKNGDGTINDGSELFGALTGDGFSDLAGYDDDKNGWIDQNDAVFSKLKLWKNAGTDAQKLVGLAAAGIGALYTGSAATSFHVQEANNAQSNLGVIQATGLFLNEDGSTGTIQHVDLSV